jgi:hypothetical protein
MTGETFNPYAPPRADQAGSGAVPRLEGGLLVIPLGFALPPVCLFTGRGAPGEYRVLDLALLGTSRARLTYFVAQGIITRNTRVTRAAMLVIGLLALLFILGMFVNGVLGVVAILSALVLLPVYLRLLPRLQIERHDDHSVWLRKVHPQAIAAILAVPPA